MLAALASAGVDLKTHMLYSVLRNILNASLKRRSSLNAHPED